MKSPHLLIALAVWNVPIYIVVLRTFFDDPGRARRRTVGAGGSALGTHVGRVAARWLYEWAKTKLLVACVLCGLLILLEYGTVKDHAPAIVGWLDQAL